MQHRRARPLRPIPRSRQPHRSPPLLQSYDTRCDGQSNPGSISDVEPHGPTVAKPRGWPAAPPYVTGCQGSPRRDDWGPHPQLRCLAPSVGTSTATNGPTGSATKASGRSTRNSGPFYIAFTSPMTVRTAHTRPLPVPRLPASWYRGHPFFGTIPASRLPPRDADPVFAGSTSGLPRHRQHLAHRPAGPRPRPPPALVGAETCHLPPASSPSDPYTCWPRGTSSADGRWKIIGLPINYDYIVGAIPPFQTRAGPCGQSDESPPRRHHPRVAAGVLRRHLGSLAEPGGRDDAFAWATDPIPPTPPSRCATTRRGSISVSPPRQVERPNAARAIRPRPRRRPRLLPP